MNSVTIVSAAKATIQAIKDEKFTVAYQTASGQKVEESVVMTIEKIAGNMRNPTLPSLFNLCDAVKAVEEKYPEYKVAATKIEDQLYDPEDYWCGEAYFAKHKKNKALSKSDNQ